MKYKARQMSNGKFAVFAKGTQYFEATVRDTQEEADIQACIVSADWHRMQMDKCQVEWEKIQETRGESHTWQDWGNCMA